LSLTFNRQPSGQLQLVPQEVDQRLAYGSRVTASFEEGARKERGESPATQVGKKERRREVTKRGTQLFVACV
jgi:hypothetical protein